MEDSRGKAAISNLYACYRKNATVRGYSFDISKEFFAEITKQKCYYCGKEPSNLHTNQNNGYNYYYTYNGIDRKNNSLGYKKDNCIPCCSQCNRAKGTLSSEEYIAFIKRVYDFSIKK